MILAISLDSVLSFITNLVSSIFAILDFITTFLIGFPIFLIEISSSLPSFIQGGLLLIFTFMVTVAGLKIASWIMDTIPFV